MYKTSKQVRSEELGVKSKEYKQNLKTKITRAEQRVFGWLKTYKEKNRIKGEYCPKYQFQKAMYKGDAFIIVDFYFQRSKTCLEIDGGYHSTPEQKGKDAWKDRYIVSRGMNVLRLTNEQVMDWSYDDFFYYLKRNDVII